MSLPNLSQYRQRPRILLPIEKLIKHLQKNVPILRVRTPATASDTDYTPSPLYFSIESVGQAT